MQLHSSYGDHPVRHLRVQYLPLFEDAAKWFSLPDVYIVRAAPVLHDCQASS